MIDVISMLRRLAVLGLLLAPLPAAAEEGWYTDPRSGCKAWAAELETGITIRWAGACAAGLVSGRGRLEYIREGQITSWQEGEFRSGKLEGRGLRVYPTGGRTEGEYRGGMLNGRGIETWPSGNRYEGEWKDDKRDGRGTMTIAKGGGYEGEWKNNLPDGQGVGRGVAGNTGTATEWRGRWVAGCYSTNGRTAWFGKTEAQCFD